MLHFVVHYFPIVRYREIVYRSLRAPTGTGGCHDHTDKTG